MSRKATLLSCLYFSNFASAPFMACHFLSVLLYLFCLFYFVVVCSQDCPLQALADVNSPVRVVLIIYLRNLHPLVVNFIVFLSSQFLLLRMFLELQHVTRGTLYRSFALEAIFDDTFCHSNSVTTPVKKVHPRLSKKSKEMPQKMAASTNDVLKGCRS